MQNEILNLNEGELFGLISRFNLKPLGRNIIVTLNNHLNNDEDLLETDLMLNEEQFIVAIGNHVVDLLPGDKVALDLEKLLTIVPDPNDSYSKITKIKVNPVKYENYTFGLIDSSTIKYIIK